MSNQKSSLRSGSYNRGGMSGERSAYGGSGAEGHIRGSQNIQNKQNLRAVSQDFDEQDEDTNFD